MNELKDLSDIVNPHEILLVIDAMMGQDAINVINGFNNKLSLTGAILTKMDGNTKGGVALSVRHLTNVPIKFVGDSEKLDGLSEFYPERMAERILDMGDILSIAEKASDIIDEQEALDLSKKMKKGNYDLEELIDKNLLLVDGSIRNALLCVKNILAQDVGCGANGRVEGVLRHPFF